MSRKGQIRVREIPADPKYHDRTVAKFMNVVMERGKKSLAEQIFYHALDLVTERSRRVGGANYQVPSEVRPVRRNSLAMRWLVAAARARGEKSMEERLAAEILDAAANRGGGVKKREDTHRMADANKAFAHYRW